MGLWQAGDMNSSEMITQHVRVNVRSTFIPERSSVTEGSYFFAYRVSITNEGDHPVKLLSRHWVITDADARVEEVSGPGVVGEQPLLTHGEGFTYTSGCMLKTPSGTMQGTYQMLRDGGETFDAEIAPFTLSEKVLLH